MVVKHDNENGIGLILALMILALLSMLIGAMLTAVTVEVWVGNNYRTESRLVYLAEAGIEDGREAMRSEAITPSADPFIQRTLLDTDGRTAGRYSVLLIRSNPPTLKSTGDLGPSRKTIEVRLRRAGFPSLAQAITLNEDIPLPAGTDPQLQVPERLERIVDGIVRHADDIRRPAYGEVVRLGAIGSPTEYRVVVLEGNGVLDNATGYGLLLVRGELELQGMVSWHGLILAIGQGVVRASDSSTVGISGALFLTRTRADDRSATNPLGTLLPQRGPVTLDLPAASATVAWSEDQIDHANRRFPYVPATWREY